MSEPEVDSTRFSRRGLLIGGAGVTAGLVGSFALGRATADAPDGADSAPSASGAAVAASGVHQAGVARPTIPQRHALVLVGSLATLSVSAVSTLLAAVGQAILRVTDAADPLIDVTPDGPGDLTVTVGVGPRVLALGSAIDPAVATLPLFKGDDAVDPNRLGGDLLLSVNSDEPGILEPVLDYILGSVQGVAPVWTQFGFRGASTDGVTRNPFGYLDGIIVPRGEDQLALNVWIDEGALTDGTICVIRRFRLDTAGLRVLPRDRQDAIMGRKHAGGEPLSGGTRDSEVNLLTKSESGDFLTPARSHARAAHPSFTGSDLMLRRSYNFNDGLGDAGHLFISFQKDVADFTRTQLRLDEVDDLMAFVEPDGGGAFAILPGFSADRPLGATLF